MSTRNGGRSPEIDQIESLLRRSGRYGTRTRGDLHQPERYDRKFLVRVSFVFSVLSLVFILGAVFHYFRKRDVSNPSGREEAFARAYMEESADEIHKGSLSAEDAVELVRTALQNRDVSLVESYFILGASAATPRAAIELLEDIETRDGLPDGFEALGGKVAMAARPEEVMVQSVKGGLYSNRLAQLISGNGKWRIDLDSYARHASPGWEDILGLKCDAAVVRVFVTPDNYYNGEKYGEDLWKCYALISPDVDDILFGYAARGSAQEKAMDRILSKEEELHRASLKILTAKEQGRMQFEISRVLADDWFIGESHFDESF